MQPHANSAGNGQGRRIVAGSPAAATAARLSLPVLAAVMLTATLLLALHATATAAPAAPQLEASAPPPAIAQLPSDNGGEDDDDNNPGRGKRDEVVGVVVAAPEQSPNGFLGDWRLAVNSRRTVTVTITADTEIDDDFGAPPQVGDSMQVRGTRQGDVILAKRLRPNQFESGEVVVRLAASEEITQEIERIERRYELVLVGRILESAHIYLFASDEDIHEDNVLQKMNEDRAIQWAELNYVSGVPTDPEGDPYRTWKWGSREDTTYTNQAALQQINLLPAQGHFDGSGIVVAVLDTGIDASHPAFAGRLLPGRDLVSEDDSPQDGPEAGEEPGLAQGHGTHISGIITRIAPGSKLLPVRVLDVNGRGNTYVLAYAIEWATENGADVINLSLGSEFGSKVLSDTIAAAQQEGVVIVAAAGNDSAATPQYPANFPGVLGVTAVDEGNHKADFANYGAAWIDLAAPGVGITSTVPLSGSILYAAWSGTSMAVPFVTAAAALVRQQIEQQQPGVLPEPGAVAAQLTASGRDLDADNPQYAGELGRLLDIGGALGIVADAPPALYLPTVRR